MKLNLSRFFSDRLIYDESLPSKLRPASSFWGWLCRLISWIWSPELYTEENRRTVSCFKRYLIDQLGAVRLQKISARYDLHLDEIEQNGSSLLSRDVAKIITGVHDVKVEDINTYIQHHPEEFPHSRTFQDVSSATFFEIQQKLSQALPHCKVPPITKKISGKASEWLARIFYDPFLADRERLHLCKENRSDTFDTFLHNMVARVIKRELEVGMLIPGPDHSQTRTPQFYYVAAAVITGKGMVSYILLPATSDTDLQAVRLFRGTAARSSEIDGISSVATDLERDLGRTAYESGLPYELLLRQKVTVPLIEAGHSLGSTIVQYRLANLNIPTAYLYCGPGIPESEVMKFNRRRDPVHLVIRQAATDAVSSVGQIHLGYQAPPNVRVDFLRYYSPRKAAEHHPHVAVWGRERHYGVEGGLSEQQRNIAFYHKYKIKEWVRSLIGPPLAFVLCLLRDLCRLLFSTKATERIGLTVGSIHEGRWQIERIRA